MERLEAVLKGPRHPEKDFVLGVWSYADVYAMADRLRQFFRAPGRGAGEVCLCAEDRGAIAAALLASLAGGPPLLLPNALSAGALADLHGQRQYRFAITDGPRPLPPGVQEVAAGRPHADRNAPERIVSLPAGARVDPDRLWVRLFTGGSTGTPRIWPKTVRNLMGEALYQADKHGIKASDRLVSTVWGCHIYGLLYSVLAPLSASASVAPGMPAFPAEIETAVNDHQATILVSVPAHFHALNGYPFKKGSLRMAFSSAGMLAEEDGCAFSSATGIAIVEVYGSTETGGVASRTRALGETDFSPFDVAQVRIDEGILEVRSAFISPGLPEGGDGFFRMGDRAAPAGGKRFRLLGRADGIVKVGGKRVDLEAVRQCLKRHPGVRDAVVIALPAPGGRENRVVAVVAATLQAEEIHGWLNDILEPYERPRSIRVVESIPMTGAGKIDRAAIEAFFN